MDSESCSIRQYDKTAFNGKLFSEVIRQSRLTVVQPCLSIASNLLYNVSISYAYNFDFFCTRIIQYRLA